MKYGSFLSILFFVGLSCSCAGNSATSKHREVTLDNNYRTTKDGATMVDDRDFDHNQRRIETTGQSVQETPQLAADDSQIKTMIDGFGNRIETRMFVNHPLLQRIILRTFTNGQKKAFVYGQNGDVNDLPDEMQDKAMNGSANELAKAAGILTGRDANNLPYFLQMLREKAVETLLPTYQFPTQSNITEPLPPEIRTEETAPIVAPIVEQKPIIVEQKPTPKRNYQADINKILLQSNKCRTAKTEGTLAQDTKLEKIEKEDK